MKVLEEHNNSLVEKTSKIHFFYFSENVASSGEINSMQLEKMQSELNSMQDSNELLKKEIEEKKEM